MNNTRLTKKVLKDLLSITCRSMKLTLILGFYGGYFGIKKMRSIAEAVIKSFSQITKLGDLKLTFIMLTPTTEDAFR